MKIKLVLVLLVILSGFTSCISSKQLIYMQNSEKAMNEMLLNETNITI